MAKMTERTDVFSHAVIQWENCMELGYGDLVDAVKNVHQQSYHVTMKAINRYATMRNWLIGYFIVEYQQKGKDRAVYGERLLKRLEESLNTRGLNVTLFQNCRLFYACYPQVADLFLLKNQPTALVKSERTERQKEIQPTASVELATDGDNLPIGILLCTKAGKKMVEYALAGMDNNLFVSTYLLQLPDKSVFEQFIRDNN